MAIELKEEKFQITTMTRLTCAKRIEKGINKMASVVQEDVNLAFEKSSTQ
ncbi:heavy metal-associated domain-containing protein [Planomicrobium sp. CPCC 101110]|nr:heavy metal-associated domain-containing protein [Planomicrobium sp. CPCC 101110]TWT25857.1 heavy-metal-associated domain-containing protein [Planomicrobium sp. CPCC 101110]